MYGEKQINVFRIVSNGEACGKEAIGETKT
jgi:hypothetical protein